MALTEEQVKNIKKQIIEQIKSWDQPEQKKKQAIQQIQQMNAQQLEEFVKKNNKVNQQSQGQPAQPQQGQQCPYCLISEGKIDVFQLAENEDAKAVLEIKPVSEGHTTIIPKRHITVDQYTEKIFNLALKIAKLLKKKIQPQDISISTSNIEGHTILNVIPVNEGETNERKEVSKKELKQLHEKLIQKEIKQEEPEEVIEEPRRIP